MAALRIICGSILALIALFVGGCSMAFAGAFLADPGSSEYGFWTISALGLVAFPFITLGAWLLLRAPDSELDAAAAARRLGSGRILGVVTCAMIALLMVGESLFLLTFADELDMGGTPGGLIAVYFTLGLIAALGAVRVFRGKPLLK